MKKFHYLVLVIWLSGCQETPQNPPTNPNVKTQFVNACVASALKNNPNQQQVSQICECVFDTSEREYGNKQEWENAVAQFNQAQTTDPKLQRVTQQAVAQCRSQ